MIALLTISLIVLFVICLILLLRMQQLDKEVSIMLHRKSSYIPDEIIDEAASQAEAALHKAIQSAD